MAHNGGLMTDEDEAFEDLAKRQGDWGLQGSRKHQILRYVESKGTSMTPTPKLRFVERKIYWDEMEEASQIVRILQQWWAVERDGQVTPTGEWRDVPLEIEQGDKHD